VTRGAAAARAPAAAVLPGSSDADLMAALTAVRGIGPWTVHMFSMFHLGRPDVLPVGDLAVRKVRQAAGRLAGSASCTCWI
jgi:3-methyladenine DNA glycosylase/8-oxoguanine DNA glycosylase